ncbi:hypothetical protein LLG46_09555 [bacterium]|nr:hypothetical protein [bacterium]
MDPKVLFVITITTARMFMPGMSGLAKIPGMNMPDMSAPTRTITMDLTSDQKPQESYKAECAIPEGLKLGPKVDLKIDIPEKSTTSQESFSEDESTADKSGDMKMKTYWGCGQSIPDGQPKILDTKSMGMISQQSFKSGKLKTSATSRIIDKDNTHAYWPNGDFKGIAKDAAAAPGDYDLTTNFCGQTKVMLKGTQDFLEAIEIMEPGKKGADVTKAIPIKWKAVANAKAYLLMAFASSGNEIVTWTSSSSPDFPMDLQYKAIKKSDLDDYVKKGILLPGDATSCCIPAGVFSGKESPMLAIIAFGADKIQDRNGIEANVVIRSTATMTLGAAMQMEDDDESDEPDEAKVKKDDVGEEEEVENDDSADVVDQADEALDKIEKTDNVINRAKRIFKR